MMKKVILEPLKIRRLAEIVETHIRDLILDGEIKVGERLPTEKGLCEQFGVSSVTAREALKGLEVLGLIEKKKGKGGGIFVSQAKSDTIKIPLYNLLKSRNVTPRHLTELRLILEPAAIRRAISEITSDEIKELERNVNYCRQKIEKISDTFSEKEFFDIEEKNVEFHRLIAEATHNPILAITVDYVMDFLFTYKKKILSPDIEMTQKTIEDHLEIFMQLKKGNVKSAEGKMIKHLKNVEGHLRKQETYAPAGLI